MKTKLIASWKLVKGDLYIVTTIDGDVIWVPKVQFDSSSETITFEFKPKGTAYKDKAGADALSKSDRNEFLGCGRQVIKKISSVELFKELHALGITPAVNLS